MRTFVCSRCRQECTSDTTTGPLPSVCDPCDPERAEKRRRGRARNLSAYRRNREEIQAAKARIAQLEAMLGDKAEAFDGEVGRNAVTRAVRRVAMAEGAQATARALRELAAAAEAWAVILSVPTAKASAIEKGIDESLAGSLL